MDANPYFVGFAGLRGIADIASIPKWTVSDSDKRPLDMFQLRQHLKYGDPIKGARRQFASETEYLEDVLSLIPNTANLTYLLDARRDGVMVMDIEPTCPDDIKMKLLHLPYIYGEVSSSGKGYHLLLPLPDRDDIADILNDHSVLKQNDKYYEILLNHWCMFTGRRLVDAPGGQSIDEVFDELLNQASERARSRDLEYESVDTSSIDDFDQIMFDVSGHSFDKRLSDFGNDESRYEFYQISQLHKWLWRYLESRGETSKYTIGEIATILYYLAVSEIPYRPKHDSTRRGEPYLMFTVRMHLNSCSFGLPANLESDDGKES